MTLYSTSLVYQCVTTGATAGALPVYKATVIPRGPALGMVSTVHVNTPTDICVTQMLSATAKSLLCKNFRK